MEPGQIIELRGEVIREWAEVVFVRLIDKPNIVIEVPKRAFETQPTEIDEFLQDLIREQSEEA